MLSTSNIYMFDEQRLFESYGELSACTLQIWIGFKQGRRRRQTFSKSELQNLFSCLVAGGPRPQPESQISNSFSGEPRKLASA